MDLEFDATAVFTNADSPQFLPVGFACWEDGLATDEFWTAKDGTTEFAS